MFKVWSGDRVKRVSVVATGCQDLIAKGIWFVAFFHSEFLHVVGYYDSGPLSQKSTITKVQGGLDWIQTIFFF